MQQKISPPATAAEDSTASSKQSDKKDGLALRGRVWHIRKSVAGVLIAESTYTMNRRTAEKVLARRIAEVHAQAMLGEKKSATVAEMLQLFADSRKGTVGHPNVLIRFRMFEPYNKYKFNEAPVNDIRQMFIDLIASKKYAVNTVNLAIGYWNAAIKLAHKNGYRTPNTIEPIAGGTNRIRFLTKEEQAALLAQLHPDVKDADGNDVFEFKRTAQENFDFVTVLLATGAREQEIATMKMSQIDLTANTITIIRSKGGNNTTLKMSAKLREVIERRIELGKVPRKPGQGPQGRIVDGKLFASRSDHRTNSNWLRRAAVRAGLEWNIGYHVMRHSFAVTMLKAGLSIVEVQHLLGHKNINSTMCYLHVVPNLAANRAAEVLDSL